MKALIIFLIYTSVSLSQNNKGLNSSNNVYFPADSVKRTIITPFSNIGNNFIDGITGTNLIFQAAGILTSAAIITSNMDYHISTYFENHNYSGPALPAVILGATLPLSAGFALYTIGKIYSDDELVGASYAVLQSGLITVSYISLLKAITGRMHPDANSDADRKETSKTFRFGFLRSGIYRGWPSGHVGAAMSVASSLAHYYPGEKWIRILGYSWATYTILSVSVYHKGTMHWFSDAIAAGLMTYPIGAATGNFFRGYIKNYPNNIKLRFFPVIADDYSGIYLTYSF